MLYFLTKLSSIMQQKLLYTNWFWLLEKKPMILGQKLLLWCQYWSQQKVCLKALDKVFFFYRTHYQNWKCSLLLFSFFLCQRDLLIHCWQCCLAESPNSFRFKFLFWGELVFGVFVCLFLMSKPNNLLMIKGNISLLLFNFCGVTC